MLDPSQRILVPGSSHKSIASIASRDRDEVGSRIDNRVSRKRWSLVEEPRRAVVVGGVRDAAGALRDERREFADGRVLEKQRTGGPALLEDCPQESTALLSGLFAILDESVGAVVGLAVPPVVVAHAVVVVAVARHPFGVALPPVAFILPCSIGPLRTRPRALVKRQRVRSGDNQGVPPILMQGFGHEVGGEKLKQAFLDG